MACRHMKRCSLSLIIREMQIETTMRYHFTLFRMAIINKATHKKCWQRCGENITLLYCQWDCKLVQPLWKTGWRVVKKLKIELLYDPEISPLGIYLKKTPHSFEKIYAPYVYCRATSSSQDIKTI